jgi:hypothetical protein
MLIADDDADAEDDDGVTAIDIDDECLSAENAVPDLSSHR